MCRWKFRWLPHTSLAIAAWIAFVPTSASHADSASPTGGSDGVSTLQIITQDDSTRQASDGASIATDLSDAGAAEAADQPAASAQQMSEEPSALPDQIPDSHPVEPMGQAAVAADTAVEATLQPVPDPRSSGLVSVETASFNGITPGVSTLQDVQNAWGPPKEITNRNAQLMHLYTVEPFPQVEVSFVKDRVSAIVIRLERAFPADLVVEKLELSDFRPVLVSDELGQVLGQSFPERGVLFAFEPSETAGTASMKVVQIVLEPITAEAFVLRAETHLDSQPDLSMRDLDEAVRIDPTQARAHWLRSRLLAARGDAQAALDACSEAVRLEPSDGQYRLSRAQMLGQLGRFAEAIDEAEKALPACTSRPHVKARALCLLGDLLSSQPEPDYRRAIEYHMEAIKTADPLAVSRHPAVRIAAKEVMVDAHLGAAHDIAWGPWEQKEKAVPRWLEQAAAVATDLVTNDGGSAEVDFRVVTRGLATLVGMRGRLSPNPWADETLRIGQQLIASAPDPGRKEQIRWDLGTALYDVVQIYQMRGDHQNALVYGKRAVGYLEPAATSDQASLADVYLLGRLYFRLGAIHAVGQRDHAAAIDWFEKAIPVFERSVDAVAQAEYGRLGETYVSMGVSFWESGQQDRAVQLTQRGVELMERAVQRGSLEQSALEVPYNNLATMARHLGRNDEADRYLQEARKNKSTALR